MPPLSLMIKPVSGLCNMRCRYCFYSDVMAHRETKVHEAMSLETFFPYALPMLQEAARAFTR